MGVGFTHGTNGFNKLTVAATFQIDRALRHPKRIRESLADTATHAFSWFRDARGKVVYFEALEGRGWRGPLAIEEVRAWAAAEPKRWVEEHDLTPWLSSVMDERHRFCMAMKGRWEYNVAQLGLQGRVAQLSRSVFARSFFKATPNDVICSEAAAVVCSNPPLLNFERWCGCGFDYITPEGLRAAVKKLTARR